MVTDEFCGVKLRFKAAKYHVSLGRIIIYQSFLHIKVLSFHLSLLGYIVRRFYGFLYKKNLANNIF
jgi:hypothetical protein